MPCVDPSDHNTKRVPDVASSTRSTTTASLEPQQSSLDDCGQVKPAGGENFTTCPSVATNIHEEICHIVMIPVVTLILATNAVVFIHSARTGHFRHPGQWFIASLYVADVLVGITSVGTVITSTHETSLELCLTRLGFFLSSIVSSIHFLMLIAIDRFLAVTHALTYRKLVTPRIAYAAIIATTTACLLIGFAPLAGWTSHSYDEHCSFAYSLEPEYIVFIMVGSILPIIVILIIYVFLYNKALFHIRRIEAVSSMHGPHPESPQRHGSWVTGMSAQGWRCLRRLVALVGCLIVTWSPFIVASILDISSVDTPCWLKDVIGTHFLVLGLTNSLLNPLVYTVSTRDFKHSFKRA
ncbi:hypothetical protein Btru_071487 [Bulinus truncatus]|nr:hypothetical protein Btru_071487 [Bulinus truncatus]